MPYSGLSEVSKGVAKMHRENTDPRVALHVTNQGTGMGTPPQGKYPGIAFMLFDAHGEKHALSEDGFGWIFKMPDATVISHEISTLQKMNALAENFRSWQGNNMFWVSY